MENRVEDYKFLFFMYVFFNRTYPHRTSTKSHLFYENGHKMGSVSNSVLGIKKTADFEPLSYSSSVCYIFFTFGWVMGVWKNKMCNYIYYCLICYLGASSEVLSGMMISKLFSVSLTSWILSIFSSFNIFSIISRPI